MSLNYNGDFNSSYWSQAFPGVDAVGIKWDPYGNFYLLDSRNNVYAANSLDEIVIRNVSDF